MMRHPDAVRECAAQHELELTDDFGAKPLGAVVGISARIYNLRAPIKDAGGSVRRR